MLTFSGYQITEILYESLNSLVYRAYRQHDKQPVVLKMLKGDYLPLEKLAWFKREYEVTHRLELAGVVTAYSLESDYNRWLMVLEDFGGESLERLKVAGKLALPDFLKLVIAVTDTLSQIHQQHIMHKDINLSNIIFNPQTGVAKINDFGISTILSLENPSFRNPNVLEGTLAYLSPEQTGRMNRAMDYRTDFYSLGVTFYELLTGQLPFTTADALELVHCHIAKHPRPPHELKPDIPLIVSEIVLKLMAKNAEDRYQSAYGLKADLEECLCRWQSTGQIDAFLLGQHDLSDRFQTPQKLYGREQEIELLLAAFERVAGPNGRKGHAAEENLSGSPPPKSKIHARQTGSRESEIEMMLVTGYAGIGKSALIQEIYKPITYRRGYFISGKFDQLPRHIPYAALIQALQSLIRQLLTESETEIAAWRDKLLVALGPNGRVISEVIPEMDLIVGPQPEMPDLPPAETQNRFNLVFQNFINVFTKPEHPLVIFLDDLQWVDSASLKLIELLMTTNSGYLFLIGAYRDNEVGQTHPLQVTLAEIEQTGVTVNYISLTPLALAHLSQLIAATLDCEPAQAEPLAELVLAKTGGNPFFINEFLKALYREGLLEFVVSPAINAWGEQFSDGVSEIQNESSKPQKGGWQWDLAEIKQRGLTDNVVELLAGKVQQLPEASQRVLKLAACIGNQFDLETLAIVHEKSLAQTATDLWAGIVDGLIWPLGETYRLTPLGLPGFGDKLTAEYKFAHDRIQQAVYSLIPVSERQAVHWGVGQLLLRNTPLEEQEQKIFDIVAQLNEGRLLIRSQAEADELARLNLLAGQKAKVSAAYQTAFNYLQTGFELLTSQQFSAAPDNSQPLPLTRGTEAAACWQRQYNLSLSLYEETAEAAYLSGQFEEMEQLTEIVLQQAQTLLDKMKVYEVRIQAYTAQNKPLVAINTTLQVLKMLGINFPEQPTDQDIYWSWEKTQAAWVKRGIPSLFDLPEMSDLYHLKTLAIIKTATAALFNANPMLLLVLVTNQVDLSIEYGNAPTSAFAYAIYGLLLCAFGDVESGYQFGQLGLNLMERFNAVELKGKIYFLTNWSGRSLKEPLRTLLRKWWPKAYRSSVEIGDLEYAAYSASGYCQALYMAGLPLTEVEPEMAKYSQAIARFRQVLVNNWHRIYWQGVLNLMGRSEHPYRLIGDVYDEEKSPEVDLDDAALGHLYTWKLTLCYQFQEFQQAVENLKKLEKYFGSIRGTGLEPSIYLYSSLAYLAVFPDASALEQADILKKIATDQEKMKLWAKHAPANYLHKFYLVEAEQARVLGHDQAARDYYDQAIELAHQHEYLNEEALAYELTGRFYLARGQTRLAGHYLRDAHYAYLRWGALAKVKDLEQRYPQFMTQAEARPHKLPASTIQTTGSSETISSVLDLASVLKASQAISGEIVLDKLLASLMKIVIENAGAQRGYLLLEEAGRWMIEAEAEARAKAEAEVMALQAVPVEQSGKLPLAIINYVARTRENVVLNDASQEGIFSQDAYIRQNQSKSILCAPLVNQGKLNGILYLENNLTSGAFTPDRLEVLNILSAQAAISIENARLYAHQVQLTHAAGRFVPYEFLQFLQKQSIVKLNLGDQAQHNMTILVSDIRSFTTLSETMTPQENFDFVNAYLGRVSPIIRQHHGFIAKYMGDGLMAVFPNRVEDALNAAIAQLQEVAHYNTERRQRGEVPIQIGLGIHAGPVMLGTVGEAERMQLDLLSDAVNVTARLEGLTKLYGVTLVISTEVLKRLEAPAPYHLRFLGKTQVKGRQEMLSVFEIFDGDPAEVIALKLETKADFEKGLSFYYDWEFTAAKIHFEQVLRRYPTDKAAYFYLKRIADFTRPQLPGMEISTEVLLEQ